MNSVNQPLAGEATGMRSELTGCQDVRVATDLHRNLIELLGANQSAVLDCTHVDSFDAAALQLLLAAKRETGDKLSIIAPHKSNAESWISLSGLKSQLLPELIRK